jgi:hypothetical protein
LGDAEPTHDGSVRLRPPLGVVAHAAQGRLDLAAVATVLGEVSIPERALHTGVAFEGPLRAGLLVENLSTFCDLPAIEGCLIVHGPGWDTATLALLLECLGHVPLLHFGDLDPNCARIFYHLRRLRSDLSWFVPDFWSELIATHALPREWPDHLDLADAPPLVHDLATQGLWLEQEPLAVDPRTPLALDALLG